MKVVCINDNWTKFSNSNIPDFKPVIGDIYTVVDCLFVSKMNIYVYVLKEFGLHKGWGVGHFVPFDSFKQDELNKELSEIFKKEKV